MNGDDHFLQSRNGRPLNRYFPELRFPPGEYVLDGELVILADGRPAGLRRARAADPPRRVAGARCWPRRRPVRFVAFDLLEQDGEVLLDEPFAARRKRLEKLVAQAARPDARGRSTAPTPSRGSRAPRA